MDATDVERQVRAICASFPEVTERVSPGVPSCCVGKQFVMLWPAGHQTTTSRTSGAPRRRGRI